MKRTLILIVATVIAATATPANATMGSTAVWTCSKAAQKPSRMNIWCYHATIWTKKMRWSKWSPSKAIAHSLYVVNTCDVNCAEGPFLTYKARLDFSKPRRFEAFRGSQTQLNHPATLYTKMRVRFTGEWPNGWDERPYVLRKEHGPGAGCELIWRQRGDRIKPC